jgi:predicted TIM-barrel fold metal-dependent hydrolase
VSRVVDIHAHVFPDDVAASAMPALEAEADVKAAFDGTVAGLLAQMDRAGIDVAVTQPVATKPSQVARINDWAASTASERIVPFGGIHPDSADPKREIARMAAMGLTGIKLHPEYQSFRPDEPRMAPIYEAIAEHDMIILFHAGLDIGIPTDYGRPEAFARMLYEYPDLTAILAHMGGWNLWDEVREHLLGLPVYFDTSYAYGHMSDDDFLDLVEGHGADRVLFGTDGPWADASAEVAWLGGLALSDDDREAILGGNAEGLLGL